MRGLARALSIIYMIFISCNIILLNGHANLFNYIIYTNLIKVITGMIVISIPQSSYSALSGSYKKPGKY